MSAAAQLRGPARTLPAIALLTVLVTSSTSQRAEGHEAGNPYALSISEDGRFILRSDATPFFWLGDTAWELFHRATREDVGFYLQDRAEKGFTVIQAVLLAELDGLRIPNAYGEVPLEEMDPTRPNERYFTHVDHVVERARELGMYMGLLPTWGDKFNLRWGIGPEVFTPANAYAYGRFLGERYRGKPVIWILGGDRNPEQDAHLLIVREMARGIGDGNGVGQEQLITYHPMGGSKSWEWFQDDDWLDVHLFQSSHGAWDAPNHRMTAEGNALRPRRPVIDGEPRYEDHPVGWNTENGWFSDFDVRQAAYWSMLSGAAGHTYGDHNIWQLWQPGREPVSWARTPWRDAVAHPGSAQVGFMRTMLEERDWSLLLPDQSLLAADALEGAAHIRAARAADGSYAYVYMPYGHAVDVDLTRMAPARVRARWFNPRTGTYIDAGEHATAGPATFDPPGHVTRGNDWVLVLERTTDQTERGQARERDRTEEPRTNDSEQE